MSIYFSCPHCRRIGEVKSQQQGTTLPCPGCGKLFTAPRAVVIPPKPVGNTCRLDIGSATH